VTLEYGEIQRYVANGLIAEQAHPDCPEIHIFNYTPACQYARAWDHVTQRCRGLMLNIHTGAIIANPFEKFFNYGEVSMDLPDEIPHITEKLDGSLGISYWLPGEQWPRVATRGSFVSSQAQWATAWLRQSPHIHLLDREITELFEIIYPGNQIVVRYDFAELVHLASRVTTTGQELLNRQLGFRQPKRIPPMDFVTLASLNEANAEGFVVWYPQTGLRLKIKFATYLRLHKILTHLSVKDLWEMLRDGHDPQVMLTDVPDEVSAWMSEVTASLHTQFRQIESAALEDFAHLRERFIDLTHTPRKVWAEAMLMCRYPHVLFRLLDGKDCRAIIWKLCQPRNGDVTFRIDG
jgi:RNA ligase